MCIESIKQDRSGILKSSFMAKSGIDKINKHIGFYERTMSKSNQL
jgi:hypothetical protein